MSLLTVSLLLPPPPGLQLLDARIPTQYDSYEAAKAEWMRRTDCLAVACVRALHQPEGSKVGAAQACARAASRCPCREGGLQSLAACESQSSTCTACCSQRLQRLAWLCGLQAEAQLLDCTANVLAFVGSLFASEEFTHRMALEALDVGAAAGACLCWVPCHSSFVVTPCSGWHQLSHGCPAGTFLLPADAHGAGGNSCLDEAGASGAVGRGQGW
jgi:hypothetical protein